MFVVVAADNDNFVAAAVVADNYDAVDWYRFVYHDYVKMRKLNWLKS